MRSSTTLVALLLPIAVALTAGCEPDCAVTLDCGPHSLDGGGAAATGGSAGDGGTSNTGGGGAGSGGTGNTGGENAGGGGGMIPDGTVTFEETVVIITEAPTPTEVVLVLGLPNDVALRSDVSVTVAVGAASTATPGDDVIDPTGSVVTFPAGSADGATASFLVRAIADVEREGNETLILELSSPQVDIGNSATVTIVDDDTLLVGTVGVDSVDRYSSAIRTPTSVLGFSAIQGAAYDSVSDISYVVTTGGSSVLGTVNTGTGEITPVGHVDWNGLSCLAFDDLSGTLYGIDDDTLTLIAINVLTWEAVAVGSEGALDASTNVSGLTACAYDGANGVLYATSETPNNLLTVDTTTGVATKVGADGSLSVPSMDSLIYDAAGDVLYGSSNVGARRLYTVDRSTGEATVDPTRQPYAIDASIPAVLYDSASDDWFVFIDNTSTADPPDAVATYEPSNGSVDVVNVVGADDPQSLAFDTTSGKLWAVSRTSFALVEYDLSTGRLVGGVPLSSKVRLNSLAYAPITNKLYAGEIPGDIHSIDPSNGFVTRLGSAGANITGLAYDASAQKLYGVSTTALYDVSPITGNGTLIGTMAGVTSMQGLTMANGVLYGVESNGKVWTINTSNGAATEWALTGGAYALAFDPNSSDVIGMNRSRAAWRLDTTTRVSRTINGFAITATGLAFDPIVDVVYAAEGTKFWALDEVTDSATFVGEFVELDNPGDAVSVAALAFDPAGLGSLYAVYYSGDLGLVDVSSGEIEHVGGIGETITALAYDRNANILYGASTTELFSIDKSTATPTFVGTFTGGFDNMVGLGFDPVSGVLVGVSHGVSITNIGEVSANGATALVRRTHQGASAAAFAD